MSIELKSIKGRYEIPRKDEMKSDYGESTLRMTRFSGGKKGLMVQLTVCQANGDTAYVQLTKEQAAEMIAELKRELGIGSWKL